MTRTFIVALGSLCLAACAADPGVGFLPGAELEALRAAPTPASTLAPLAEPVLAFATPAWHPEQSLPRRAVGSVAFDGESGCVVTFGGLDASLVATDTLSVRCDGVWQGGVPAADGAPSARQDAAMSHGRFADASRDGVYLFGGRGASVSADFWSLVLGGPDGHRVATWTPMSQTTPWPPARAEAGMVATAGGLLLFGGVDGNGNVVRDTWRWNGTTWEQLCAGDGCFPGLRGGTAFVIGGGATPTAAWFGGFRGTAVFDELYTFDAVQRRWRLVTSDTAASLPTLLDGRIQAQQPVKPSPRYLAWAAQTETGAVLGGGADDAVAPGDPVDVWRLERNGRGFRWDRVPVTATFPGPRIGAIAAFDDSRGEVVIVGGASSWFGPAQPPALSPTSSLVLGAIAATAELEVICRDPVDDVCASYTLELRALPTAGGGTPLRATFARLSAGSWKPVAACGTHATPLVVPTSGNLRCEVVPSPFDAAYAVQLSDARYLPGGAACGQDPICNPAGSYAGRLGCFTLPVGDDVAAGCF
jgi:hypothetical protein